MIWNNIGAAFTIFAMFAFPFASLCFVASLVKGDKSMRKTAFRIWGISILAFIIGYALIVLLGEYNLPSAEEIEKMNARAEELIRKQQSK